MSKIKNIEKQENNGNNRKERWGRSERTEDVTRRVGGGRGDVWIQHVMYNVRRVVQNIDQYNDKEKLIIYKKKGKGEIK